MILCGQRADIELARDLVPGAAELRLALAAEGAGFAVRAEPPAAGDEQELLDRIAGAPAIELVAADPRDWIAALFPKRTHTPLARALWDRFRTGTPLIACGRAAALASLATWVEPAERRAIERNPRAQDRPELVWGLGFLPWGMVATDAEVRGDLGTLLALARRHDQDQDMRLAVHLPVGSALIADLREHRCELRGKGPVLFVDLLGSRRSRDWIQDLRVSALRGGDGWSAATREGELAGEALPDASGSSVELSVERALAVESFTRALNELASASGPRAVVLRGTDARVRLARDAWTRAARTPRGTAFSRLVCDVVWER